MVEALQDSSLKTEERLKVACVAARSSNWSLPERRSVFLAKWAAREICGAYSKRNRRGNRKPRSLTLNRISLSRSRPGVEVCGQLWEFLAAMLESEQQRLQHQREGSVLPQSGEESSLQYGSLVSVHLLQVYHSFSRVS